MTQEHKELLLKDLCSRLPYNVKAHIKKWSKLDGIYYEGIYVVESVHPSINDIYVRSENSSFEVILGCAEYVIIPYLFPLSSMSEEQSKELEKIDPEFFSLICGNGDIYVSMDIRSYDWLNKNHFDYRGLIPMGLAKDATGLNIY